MIRLKKQFCPQELFFAILTTLNLPQCIKQTVALLEALSYSSVERLIELPITSKIFFALDIATADFFYFVRLIFTVCLTDSASCWPY